MVKLLPCDHEVMGSSPGNSLLQKCRERLRTIDPKWSDPSLDPAQAGATCTGAALFFIQKLGRLTWAIKTFDENIAGPSKLDIATATADEKTWIIDGGRKSS